VTPSPSITQALSADAGTVASILGEAAEWLAARGARMWWPEEVSETRIAPDVDAGLYYLARVDGEARGTVKFQMSDWSFWFDVDNGDSAFVHRLAVRRASAGTGLSTAILDWAAVRAESLGRRYLRLDCDPRRTKLCSFYEAHGFRRHSVIEAAGFVVARYERDLAAADDAAGR
jgi:GNAT superfamily N-acetyltransferase